LGQLQTQGFRHPLAGHRRPASVTGFFAFVTCQACFWGQASIKGGTPPGRSARVQLGTVGDGGVKIKAVCCSLPNVRGRFCPGSLQVFPVRRRSPAKFRDETDAVGRLFRISLPAGLSSEDLSKGRCRDGFLVLESATGCPESIGRKIEIMCVGFACRPWPGRSIFGALLRVPVWCRKSTWQLAVFRPVPGP